MNGDCLPPKSGGERRWLLALMALLAASLAIRLPDLDADAPLDAARDLSLTVDGSWYTGAAIDRISGRPAVDPGAYDPPLWGFYARFLFWTFGPSRWTAALTAVIAGLAAIGLTAAAARRAYGAGAGLAAGALLAISYPFLAYSRAPGIYLPATAVAAAALYLEARRRSAPGGPSFLGPASYAAMLAGAIGIKSILLINGVASLAGEDWFGLWRNRRNRRLIVLAGIPAAAVALGLGLWSGWLAAHWHKAWMYLHDGGGLASIPYRAITLENRLGLLAMSPALPFLAALGGLCRPLGRLERSAVATAALYIFILAIWGYSPIRYLLPAFPALALLAARAIALLGAPSADTRRPEQRPPGTGAVQLRPWMRTGRAVLIAYILLQGMLAATGWKGAMPLGFGIAAAAVLGAFSEWSLGRSGGGAVPSLRRRRIAWTAAGLLLLSAVDLGRGAAAFAAPERSIAHAGEELTAILHPAAYLTGPFAHALTWETPHRRSFHPVWGYGNGRLGRELRQAGFSHFAVDVTPAIADLRRTLQADGAELRLVHEFVIRGQKVHLYRFPWADEIAPPTDFELGVRAIQEAHWGSAEDHLRRGLGLRPDSSALASALGLVLLETGRPDEARRLLEGAIERNPYEISACRSLLKLLLDAGDLAAARRVLDRLFHLDPDDREAARLRAALR